MKHIKNFMIRGLMFGGFGPIIFGIVAMCISFNEQSQFTGTQIMFGIISTYLLAFVCAGASVFKEIEKWSLIKAIGIHLLVLYIIYTVCYLLNSWIPFKFTILIIYTIAFIVAYAIIWIIVYLIVRKTAKKMNDKLQ